MYRYYVIFDMFSFTDYDGSRGLSVRWLSFFQSVGEEGLTKLTLHICEEGLRLTEEASHRLNKPISTWYLLWLKSTLPSQPFTKYFCNLIIFVALLVDFLKFVAFYIEACNSKLY